MFDGILYKKDFLKLWLKCVGRLEANTILRELHQGLCGSHQGAKTIAVRARRVGYYWPNMSVDAMNMVRRCEKCQYYAKISHNPAQPMKSIASVWPFDTWGIDIVGQFTPGKGQVKYLIVAVDYFTKWVEAKPLAHITTAKVKEFVKNQIFYCFGMPSTLVSDNGK